MIRLTAVFLSLLLALTFTTATNVKKCVRWRRNKAISIKTKAVEDDCSNGEPMPLTVIIEGCEEPPCDAIKGSTAVMNVHFVGIKDDTDNLTAKVKATTFGVTVPYDLPADVADVCGNLLYGAICPIYASEDVVYNFNFYLDEWYPEINVKLELSLIDEDNEVVSCFSVDIKVKKGPTSIA